MYILINQIYCCCDLFVFLGHQLVIISSLQMFISSPALFAAWTNYKIISANLVISSDKSTQLSANLRLDKYFRFICSHLCSRDKTLKTSFKRCIKNFKHMRSSWLMLLSSFTALVLSPGCTITIKPSYKAFISVFYNVSIDSAAPKDLQRRS